MGGLNQRLAPGNVRGVFPASIATNASAIMPLFTAHAAGQLVGSAIIQNSATAAVTSGTTAGSAVTVAVYKTASHTDSRLGTYNGSGTTIATQGTQAFTLGTSTSLLQFAAGDTYLIEYIGGAANNASNAGLTVQVNYEYGHETGTTPAAATGPA